ncbi:VWA domain-containing protein [Rhizobium laguerreae]|uniref:VWA domain-containing protein n=1 Tax=Rhizobium laguerreae TaxID=1076926 RepID=UPI001C914C7C|nr:VWA domain-containing protein [Rhizobium laguerreae]MBY3155392.1 VWA domain-containing protein [Rhizobium laguerreae]
MPELEVSSALDVSGSFLEEHRAGLTSTFLTRIVPWGITFDPDGKIDVFTFSNGRANAHYVGAIDASNYENYVRDHIENKVPGWGGATDYSHVLRMILAHFGWGEREQAPAAATKLGFFARLFGGPKSDRDERPQDGAPRRAIVFFVTDGVGDDAAETRQVIGEAEREGYGTFFVLVGMSNSMFPLLESLAADHGNVIFRKVEDIAAFNKMSDENLNEFFLDDKLTKWLSH